jgi:hypothetical protein
MGKNTKTVFHRIVLKNGCLQLRLQLRLKNYTYSSFRDKSGVSSGRARLRLAFEPNQDIGGRGALPDARWCQGGRQWP